MSTLRTFAHGLLAIVTLVAVALLTPVWIVLALGKSWEEARK